MHREVTEALREGRVVGLRDGIGVQLGHLAVRVLEQVHIPPPVEVRREGQRVTAGTDSHRQRGRAGAREAGGVVVGRVEDREALPARCDTERRDVTLDAHAERLVAGVGAGPVEDQHCLVATRCEDVGHLLGERAQPALDDGDLAAGTAGCGGWVTSAPATEEDRVSGDALIRSDLLRPAALAGVDVGAVGDVASGQGEGSEVLVRTDHVGVVLGELRLMAVALRRHDEAALGGLRVGVGEVGVAEVDGCMHVGHVDLDVAGVPVGQQHDLPAANVLDDHVVQEGLDEVARRGLQNLGELLVEVVLRGQERLPRVGYVHDVDIGALFVVHDDRVRLGTRVPREDAVDLVGVLLALAVDGEVADALRQRGRVLRVGDVVDVHPAEAGLVVALLVVADQDVAVEGGRVDVQGLDALTGVAALLGADEGDLARRGRVLDVHDVHAVVLARHGTPRGDVGIALEDADVGDLLGHDVLQPQLADQGDVATRPFGMKVTLGVTVLVGVASGVLGGLTTVGRDVVPGVGGREPRGGQDEPGSGEHGKDCPAWRSGHEGSS